MLPLSPQACGWNHTASNDSVADIDNGIPPAVVLALDIVSLFLLVPGIHKNSVQSNSKPASESAGLWLESHSQ